MQVLALVWGILAMVGFLFAFLPCLGAFNWLNIPFSLVGLVISIVAVAQAPEGKKGGAVAGLVMCAIAMVVGFFRLVAGGGVV